MCPTGSTTFSSAAAKEAIQAHGERVNWFNVVWFKGYVPKLAVILWMALKKRILTKTELKAWGCLQNEICSLCASSSEDINHLFFLCPFSVLSNDMECCIEEEWVLRNGMWSVKAIEEAKGTTFQAKMRCLVLATVVYGIWQERNCRIFCNKGQDSRGVMQTIEVTIMAASWHWRVVGPL